MKSWKATLTLKKARTPGREISMKMAMKKPRKDRGLMKAMLAMMKRMWNIRSPQKATPQATVKKATTMNKPTMPASKRTVKKATLALKATLAMKKSTPMAMKKSTPMAMPASKRMKPWAVTLAMKATLALKATLTMKPWEELAQANPPKRIRSPPMNKSMAMQQFNLP